MERPELNAYEIMYLTGLQKLGRRSKLQLLRSGMPYPLITRLLKDGILTGENDGGCMYYKVADDIW